LTAPRAAATAPSVPIPKFAILCSTFDANFGIERTLGIL
jgi:hypothetical protein